MPLVRTFIGQFDFAQPKLICSQGRREGPGILERFFHVNFNHKAHMTAKVFELFKNQLFSEQVS